MPDASDDHLRRIGVELIQHAIVAPSSRPFPFQVVAERLTKSSWILCERPVDKLDHRRHHAWRNPVEIADGAPSKTDRPTHARRPAP